jgi:predicted nucleic acid-binding protein
MPGPARVIYWDASAVLSTLFQDAHSEAATAWLNTRHVHLLSSLGQAEVLAVISRIRRDRRLASILVDAAHTALDAGPWRMVHDVPQPAMLRTLSQAWPLRGADLWHLALAKTLQSDLPELQLLTYDERLGEASAGEGLAP